MSQFNAGKATIDIVSDNKDANAKIDQTAQKVEEFKAKAEKGGDGFATSIKRSISAVTSLIGSITAAIGVATLFYKIGQQIRDVFEGGAMAIARTNDLVGSLNFQDVEGSLKTVTKEIQELSAVAEKVEAGTFLERVDVYLSGEGRALEERLKILRQQQDYLALRAEQLQKKKEADEQKAIEDAAVAKARADAEDAARGGEILQAEEDAYVAKVLREHELREKLRDEANEAEMKRIADQEKATMDSLKKIADEMARIRREQESGFGLGNITFAGTGNPARDAMLRARIGRGNGRF